MPVYNVQDYLEEALQSIQNQTFDDYEVLMVDDGSTDASLEIMKKYSQLDTRFISYSKENKGVSQARNYALDRAHGEYVAFLDGDDLMPKRALEAMYRTAKAVSYTHHIFKNIKYIILNSYKYSFYSIDVF